MSCCGKMVCKGCIYAFRSRATKEEHDVCPFCRTPPTSDKELINRLEKRIDLNDPIAIYNMGGYYDKGQYGLHKNRAKALEFWHRAGELGYANAYFAIGSAYYFGRGVEVDEKKAKHYYELAAMRGDIEARYNLGFMEWEAGKMDRTVKHWLKLERVLKHFKIAAKDGDSKSLESIRRMNGYGDATKDDYDEALRSYQSYLDEVKSDQRDEAAAAGR